ncbi:MAG TPA: hypothetical protein PKD55_04390 [Bellilinea sp.]|nr:hypothetical protein [Bellilinea sp.]
MPEQSTEENVSKPKSSRLGFHYFPDTFHYTDRYLQTYLPILRGLQAKWLVVNSELKRAIPEYFISELLDSGISPIVQLPISLTTLNPTEELHSLLEAYTRWGVKHVQLFNFPNLRASWPSSGWVQQDLVERFLDRFVPAATVVMNQGAKPLFPALEPGGNFWDTAFLKASLQSLGRRGESDLLSVLGLSAVARTSDKSLTWGAGGQERWPDTRPYFTPADSEDQRGIRIHEWYQSISNVILQRDLPIFIFQAGLPANPNTLLSSKLLEPDVKESTMAVLSAAQGNDQDQLEFPDYIQAVNFWLLDADPQSAYYQQAWFHDGNAFLPYAQAAVTDISDIPFESEMEHTIANDSVFKKLQRPIDHYVLLANSAQGAWEKQLARMVPYLNKHHPTVGFSLDEAFLASRVTIVGTSPFVTKDTVHRLKKSGAYVERMNDDGTIVAQ